MAKRFSFTKALGSGVALTGRAVTHLLGRTAGARAAGHAASVFAPVVSVVTARGRLRFSCASDAAAKRALGFRRQEPDTLRWIEEFVQPGEHLWDVGANVGSYGLYACLREGVTATCFEPVAGTFAILVRNIELNGLGEQVAPLCLALSDINRIAPFYLSSEEPASAMHALSKAETTRGGFISAAVQRVPAIRAETLIETLAVPPPQHLKIDVDGHERQVLEGFGTRLSDVQTVWIELTSFGDANEENARIRALLANHGLQEHAFAPAENSRNRLFLNRTRA